MDGNNETISLEEWGKVKQQIENIELMLADVKKSVELSNSKTKEELYGKDGIRTLVWQTQGALKLFGFLLGTGFTLLSIAIAIVGLVLA